MVYSADTLATAIRSSWDSTTTSTPDEWEPVANPARGQCVPTALVVQDNLGGNLERLATTYNERRETHYRNILPDGTVLDLTRSQYPDEQIFEQTPIEGDTREYVLGNEATRRRYTALARRVEALLLFT